MGLIILFFNRCPSVSSLFYDKLMFTQAIIHSHDAKAYNDQVEKDMCVYYAFYLVWRFI